MFAPHTSPALTPIEKNQVSFSGGQRDRDHPSLLKPDEYSRGINLEIREAGLGATRRGFQTKTDQVGAQFQGAIFFDPSNGSPMIVQVNGGQIWTWEGTGTSWTRIGTTQLNNVSDRVAMVVLNFTLFVFCGPDDNAHSWDGIAASFTDMGNGNTNPPRGNIACVQSGRICLAGVESTATITDARSHFFLSDIFDGSTWNRSTNNKRVPTDGDEPITAMSTYRKEEILVFTRGSTHKFAGINAATISTGVTRETLDPNIGCIAPDSVIVVGEDCFFVSADKQVRTIKRTIQDIAYGVSVPITYENPNLFNRIKSSAVNKCTGIFFDNYYLLSAPLDSNENNSSVMPFDTLHQKQSTAGVVPICLGEWAAFAAGKWVVTNFSDIPKLYFINSMTGAAALCFETTTDDGVEIPLTVDLRAEQFDYPDHDKTMHSVNIQLLDTFGNFDLSYAKDGDSSFTAFYTDKVISDPNSLNFPLSFPFNFPTGGVLFEVRARFYRRGRSKYWQLQIHHDSGPINIKYITMRAFVEMMVTR